MTDHDNQKLWCPLMAGGEHLEACMGTRCPLFRPRGVGYRCGLADIADAAHWVIGFARRQIIEDSVQQEDSNG